MGNLNIYKKIGIIILVVVLISAIATGVFLLKNKNVKNYSAEATSSEIQDIQNTIKEENVLPIENATEEGNVEENPEDTSWDEEDVEDTKVDIEKEQREKKEQNSGTKYYIKINYSANVITVYEKDDDGKYTKPVKAIICSTGTATPKSGVYKTSSKYRWHQLNGGVWGQYCTRITGHILFHSVPYSTKSPDSLKYGAYDKLGTKASAGCIRVTVADAIWLYNNCASGTQVEFYSSSDPGPLGKPTAKKVSSNVQCRNWDPTDPDSNNPWHWYVEPKQEEKVEEEQPQIQEQRDTNQNNTQNNDEKITEKTTEEKQEENNVNNKVKTDSSDNKTTDNTSNAVDDTNDTNVNNTINTNNTKINNTTNTNSESNINTNTKVNANENGNTTSNINEQKNTETDEIKDKKNNIEANSTIGNTNV